MVSSSLAPLVSYSYIAVSGYNRLRSEGIECHYRKNYVSYLKVIKNNIKGRQGRVKSDFTLRHITLIIKLACKRKKKQLQLHGPTKYIIQRRRKIIY